MIRADFISNAFYENACLIVHSHDNLRRAAVEVVECRPRPGTEIISIHVGNHANHRKGLLGPANPPEALRKPIAGEEPSLEFRRDDRRALATVSNYEIPA